MSEPAPKTPAERRRQRLATAAPFAVIGLWLCFWLWQAGAIRTPPLPPLAEQRTLLELAHAVVLAPGIAPKVPDLAPRPDVRAAIVTIYLPGTPQAPIDEWAPVEDGDIAAAVAQAAGAAGRDWEKREFVGSSVERIRIDLTGPERRVRAVVRRPPSRLWFLWRLVPSLEDVMDPGVDGLEIHDGTRTWFSGPSARVEKSQSGRDVALALLKSAGDHGALRRFRAASFVEAPVPASDPLPIVRGNVLPPWPATAGALRQAAALGGGYLARSIDDKGRFNYQFDAGEGRAEGGYNLLRHAGSLWAMFQVYGRTGDVSIRTAAERGLAYLGHEFTWRDPRVPGAVFLREGTEGKPKNGDVKLGACGLGILAYTEAEKNGVTLSDEDHALMIGLGHGILAMQQADGELRSYYTPPEGRPISRRSTYYPGEAILALMELYERDGDHAWLEGAMRGADFQIQHRWRTAGIEVQVPPDAWLTQALEELWLATKEERYKAYAYRLGDELVRTTFPPRADVPPDLRGATFTFEKEVRVTPTSSRNEAVVAAARLARKAGDAGREARYLEAAQGAAWFGIAQQFRPENMHFVRNPEAALGGIRETIADNSIRIDGVQHAASSFLGLADLLDPPPAPKTTGTSGGPS